MDAQKTAEGTTGTSRTEAWAEVTASERDPALEGIGLKPLAVGAGSSATPEQATACGR
jgi:hypothetical protein